jgi:hypothetical protein
MPSCWAKQELAGKKKRRERGKLNRGAKIDQEERKLELYAGGTSVTS